MFGVNKEMIKRASTYANLLSMVVSAALLSVGSLGLNSETVAAIMMAGNVTVAVCQFIKQEASKK